MNTERLRRLAIESNDDILRGPALESAWYIDDITKRHLDALSVLENLATAAAAFEKTGEGSGELRVWVSRAKAITAREQAV